MALIVSGLAGCDGPVEPAEVSAPITLASLTTAALPGDEAPELASFGPYDVGVATVELVNPGQIDIASYSLITRTAPTYDRTIQVDVFYPAVIEPDAERAFYEGKFYQSEQRPIPGLPDHFTVQGIAVRDASPVAAEQFPLVIFSHGLGSAPAAVAGLTENLASKGYVVAAIDHGDYVKADELAPLKIFARAMLFRSIDQQFVVDSLRGAANDGGAPWANLISDSKAGLIGFSFGGYGALNHAGAGYHIDAEIFGWAGRRYFEDLSSENEAFKERNLDLIGAVIAISPWGAQDDVKAWKNEAFADIPSPLLFIVGSQDDVVGFENGVRRIFDNARNTDRHMLVFQNAQHNLVQVPAPEAAFLDVSVWEQFEDPIWKKDRLLSVNQHFITAFLDLHLKGDESRRAYLEVPTTLSNDGTWAQPMGQYYGDQYADGTNGSENYWKGFKRRQAVGLEMHYLPRGASGAK